jgi:hypothetical protein
MSKDGTWESWNLRIKDKVWRNVRPLSLELTEEKEDSVVRRFLFWREIKTVKTGRWLIKFIYDRGPLTMKQHSVIEFDDETKARATFHNTYRQVFFYTSDRTTPPKTPSPKTKNTSKTKPLRLV